MKPSIIQLNAFLLATLFFLLSTGGTLEANQIPSYNRSKTTPSHVYLELRPAQSLYGSTGT